jgi:hypothetical protein
MARPGVQVLIKSAPPSRSAPSDTGVAFFAGLAQKGRTDVAVPIHNMDEYQQFFGARVNPYQTLYDACDIAFKTGAAVIYVGRVVGPAAVKDSKTFNDAGAAPSIAVDSIGAGASGYSAQIVAGAVAGTAHVVVTNTADGSLVTQSPDYALPVDFANWSNQDNYIRIRALGANVPAVAAATPLLAGNDDNGNVVDATKVAAIPVLFPAALGAGQLAYPGATTVATQVALANHAQNTNRVALLDGPDTSDGPTAIAAATALRNGAGLQSLAETYCMMSSPWLVVPGVVGGTTRTVPPSAVIAGLIASSDGSNNPNVPAAGANGQADIVIRLSQVDWADAVRQTLNDAGISAFKNVYGAYRLYGYRSLANINVAASNAWVEFSAARLRMAITQDLNAIGEDFVFDQVDGQRKKLAEYGGAARGRLLQYWTLGALYGASAAESFSVDVGPTVNTDATVALRELHCKIGLRTSPFAEMAYFDVTKVPTTSHL